MAIGHRLLNVDFETEVGLIINNEHICTAQNKNPQMRRHRTRKFGEITQTKSHYAVQGHSRSPILVPIEG